MSIEIAEQLMRRLDWQKHVEERDTPTQQDYVRNTNVRKYELQPRMPHAVFHAAKRLSEREIANQVKSAVSELL